MILKNWLGTSCSVWRKHSRIQQISSSLVRHQSSSSASSSIGRIALPIDVTNDKVKGYLESLRREFYDLRVNASSNPSSYVRINQLSGIVGKYEHYCVLQSNLISTQDIANEKEEDMRQLMKDENVVYTQLLQKTQSELMHELLKITDDGNYASAIFEVKAGAGGQEAMLFAKELYYLYLNYFEYKGWEYEIIDEELTDIGGLRHGSVEVHGGDAFSCLRYEGGVHRVQRVPATERTGRMHTSTASIAVIPRSADIDVTLNEADLKIETKRASGAGGQHVNTTDSAVRIVHLPTGIAVECQSDRSQLKNRELAMKRLQARLLQQQLERVESVKQASRKSQQGTQNRNEKIRTYNFVQDRITDHRLQGGTVHNLVEFMKGGQQLHDLIQRLLLEQRKQALLELLNNLPEEEAIKARSGQETK